MKSVLSDIACICTHGALDHRATQGDDHGNAPGCYCCNCELSSEEVVYNHSALTEDAVREEREAWLTWYVRHVHGCICENCERIQALVNDEEKRSGREY